MNTLAYEDWIGNTSRESGEKLSFSLFMAILFHGIIILGVTFTFAGKMTSTHTMEVTLAQYKSLNEPESSDFIAQFNQEGSGTLEEKMLITTPIDTRFHDTEIREVGDPQIRSTPDKNRTQVENTLNTKLDSMDKIFVDPFQKVEDSGIDLQLDKTMLQRSLEIASLEARLDELKQIYASRPRIKRLTSLSTRSSADAYYLNSWRRKIEAIGNLNYPEEARKNQIYGSLRLLVAITPDGHVKDIEILESSGHRSLDDAAIRIVKLASPFAPFPDELRQTTDILEIIRTWQFKKNSTFRSQ